MSSSLALAVDFGGTKVESALVTADGELVPGSRHRAPTGRAATSEQLQASVREVIEFALTAAGERELAGVGIGCAGPIERSRGLVSPLNVPNWRDFDLRGFAASVLDDRGVEATVALEMDGVAITMAEHWVGAAQGVDNVMGMVVSTGIGGGLIVGGRVITGPTGNAGHIGHVEVADIVGEETFGKATSLEAIASGPHTVAWARREGFAGATGEDLAAAYAAGDPVARAAIERTGHAVGQAIASATALLDLELVAIGGGFSQATPDLFDVIRTTIAEHYFGFVRKVRVVPSGLSGEGPLIGAAAIVHRSELLPPL
ncbi:ROK family protein [Humibacter ginsenosidimutans]|uniref:ROK family protein n=1 Tax=Humibacter ginsenosidimutans TaxID=2599293 RepID=A0A5B8M0V5_9MICO|nr:ROK family protein [Humibacter ginsenosidimutans]QDZ13455.1 ROK family protein [Humibacter ginsenosidimutans]